MLYLFKFYAKKYKQNTHYIFWNKTIHPLELFSNEMIDQKVTYIHNNPVKAGIVNEAHEYIYSSASPFSKIKVWEL
jgi:putative transposase